MTDRRQFLKAAGATALLNGCTLTSDSQTGRSIDIGGQRLNVRIWGGGAPCVVMDVGIGGTVEEWRPVIDRVSPYTCVIAWDRAGYGASDPGPRPRSPFRVAAELRSVLAKLEFTPPFLFMGHSLGAANVLAVAVEHPALVGALLLLDPPPRGFVAGEQFPELGKMAAQQTADFRRMAAEAEKQSDRAKSAFFETLASEHEALFDAPSAELLSGGGLGNLQGTVVASAIPNTAFGPGAGDFQRFWIQSNRELAGRFRHGKFVLAEGSTHQLHRDVPDLVAREALDLVKAVRGRK